MSVEGVFTPLVLFTYIEVKQLAINSAAAACKPHDCAELIFGFAGDEVGCLAGFAVVHAACL